MGNEELEPGDVVQHKATGKILVVLTQQQNKMIFRDEDNTEQDYEPFEVVKLKEEQWRGRLNQKFGESPKSKIPPMSTRG